MLYYVFYGLVLFRKGDFRLVISLGWLTALSHSSGTSSGWLKAIPSTSLGLAIPGPEFIVGLFLWLGVSLLPISPLCTCLSSIDCFGDHLLGCSHGPMRICCHDALVNILHHALLQDHPGVVKEQCASFDDSSCPGDIFHPDYQLGHPAYFDVSVCSITQPAQISSSTSCVGWLLQLERWLRMRSTLLLWRGHEVISFH